jgi:hypothetical protein
MTFKSMDRGEFPLAPHFISPADAAVGHDAPPQRFMLLDACVSPKAAPSLSGIFYACDRLKGEAQGLKDPDLWAKCRAEGYKILLTFDRRDRDDMDITRCVTKTVHGVMVRLFVILLSPVI